MATRGRPRAFDRDEALTSAMRTFWALGYEGASMAELTRAMGVSSPSLYAAFGSKDALFREAAKLYEAQVGAELAAAVTSAPTAREGVEAFLLVSAESLARPGQPPGCMIAMTTVRGCGDCPETRAALKACRGGAQAMIERRLRQGVAAGELGPSLDIAAIAGFYVTVQQGMSIQAVDGAAPTALRTIAVSAMTAWDGLTRRPGVPAPATVK